MFAATTLLEVYELALRHDPSLSAAKLSADAGGLTWDIVSARNFPTIYVESSYSETRRKSLSSFTRKSNVNQLTIAVPVYESTTKHELKKSETEEYLAELRLRKAHEQIRYRVASTYFQILATQDDLDVALREKESLKEFYQQTLTLLNAGIGTEFDIRNVEVRLDLAESTAVQTKDSLESAWLSLAEMTGVRPDVLQMARELPTYSGPVPTSVNDWVRMALENNVDIAIQKETVELARSDIHLVNSDLAFSSNLTINFRDHHGEIDLPYEKNSVVLSFGRAFSAGGLGAKRKKQATYRYQAQIEVLSSVKISIETEIDRLFQNVMALAESAELLKGALHSSERALAATEEGYRASARTSVDVLNAQRDLYQVTRDLKRAHYFYLLAIIELGFVAGVLDLAEIQQNYLF